jgi:hypothetical protein
MNLTKLWELCTPGLMAARGVLAVVALLPTLSHAKRVILFHLFHNKIWRNYGIF